MQFHTTATAEYTVTAGLRGGVIVTNETTRDTTALPKGSTVMWKDVIDYSEYKGVDLFTARLDLE